MASLRAAIKASLDSVPEEEPCSKPTQDELERQRRKERKEAADEARRVEASKRPPIFTRPQVVMPPSRLTHMGLTPERYVAVAQGGRSLR
jgi:hypothetical protein